MDLARYGPRAPIVGGSEGAGAEFARQLAADGFKLVLTARKPEPIEQIKRELEAGGALVLAHGIRPREETADKAKKQQELMKP